MLKQAIQLSKPSIPYYHFERLYCCKHCQFFTVINAERCFKCNRQSSYIHIRDYAKVTNKQRIRTIIFVSLAGILISLLFSGTISNLILFSVIGAVLIALQLLVFILCRQQILNVFMQKLFTTEKDTIFTNLSSEIEFASSLKSEGKLKEAYERLRLLGGIINKDYVKFAQLECLNQIIIRSDMDLQLDELVPTQYSPLFDHYLKEILLVKPALLKQQTYHYVTLYQNIIATNENGQDLLIKVAASMTSMKLYIERYRHFIIDHIEQFPKDKFLKLCQIVMKSNESSLDEIRNKCKFIIDTNYAFDPDFQKLV